MGVRLREQMGCKRGHLDAWNVKQNVIVDLASQGNRSIKHTQAVSTDAIFPVFVAIQCKESTSMVHAQRSAHSHFGDREEIVRFPGKGKLAFVVCYLFEFLEQFPIGGLPTGAFLHEFALVRNVQQRTGEVSTDLLQIHCYQDLLLIEDELAVVVLLLVSHQPRGPRFENIVHKLLGRVVPDRVDHHLPHKKEFVHESIDLVLLAVFSLSLVCLCLIQRTFVLERTQKAARLLDPLGFQMAKPRTTGRVEDETSREDDVLE
mmetsp:Transcript_6070/g.14800  ORF Transcript_6070/g.14800 Transcript_6070/m.14800 type:complete len:261 (-) Transcript_6070:598-1380(-)